MINLHEVACLEHLATTLSVFYAFSAYFFFFPYAFNSSQGLFWTSPLAKKAFISQTFFDGNSNKVCCYIRDEDLIN